MTLGDLFQILHLNPEIVLFYFIAVPMTAFLSYLLGRNDGHLSPWKYLYSVLIYLTTIPAIFSITLSVYFFLFENISILQTDIILQVVPILSMIITLWLIKLNVDFDLVPGFRKISGLMVVIAIALSIMWIVDRLHFIAFTYMSFTTVILILIFLLIILRWAWERIV